jgi:undecaprenyl-diphosphatase
LDIIHAIIIGLVQGLTEFLPISSSGHLVLIPKLIGFESSLVFDTVLHVGTLLAIFICFWDDIVKIIKAFFDSLADIPKGRLVPDIRKNDYKKLAWLLIIGNIPAGILGVLLKDYFEAAFSNVLMVGIFLLVTGGLLYFSEWIASQVEERRGMDKLTLKDSLIIGLAQAFAILPGISRSGSTIATGLFLGLKRDLVAEYSFLLSIPAVAGAALLQIKDISTIDMSASALIAGFLAAAISGYFAIKVVMTLIQNKSLKIFAYYCWVIGIIAIISTIIF